LREEYLVALLCGGGEVLELCCGDGFIQGIFIAFLQKELLLVTIIKKLL
jgi:hypothetical protein